MKKAKFKRLYACSLGNQPTEKRRRHHEKSGASRQGARTLELRAVTALARVCGRGAKARQARSRLADLLASFTEGFDTADLKDAKALLDELE